MEARDIITLILMVVYIGMLFYGRKYKDNQNYTITLQFLQAALWAAVAILNWDQVHMITRIVYILVAVLSLFNGVIGLRNRK